MKRFFKENIKFIIVILICIVGSGLSTYATEYLFNSNEVQYDNSTSGIRSSNVQDAIDELYTAANNYSAYDSRLTALENASSAYPVGSIYISVSNTDPSTLFGGTWSMIDDGLVLQNADSNHNGGTIINAGLPNITGNMIPDTNYSGYSYDIFSGAFYCSDNSGSYYLSGRSPGRGWCKVGFDASRSNSIYGNSETVQPNAYVVYMWKRTA